MPEDPLKGVSYVSRHQESNKAKRKNPLIFQTATTGIINVIDHETITTESFGDSIVIACAIVKGQPRIKLLNEPDKDNFIKFKDQLKPKNSQHKWADIAKEFNCNTSDIQLLTMSDGIIPELEHIKYTPEYYDFLEKKESITTEDRETLKSLENVNERELERLVNLNKIKQLLDDREHKANLDRCIALEAKYKNKNENEDVNFSEKEKSELYELRNWFEDHNINIYDYIDLGKTPEARENKLNTFDNKKLENASKISEILANIDTIQYDKIPNIAVDFQMDKILTKLIQEGKKSANQITPKELMNAGQDLMLEIESCKAEQYTDAISVIMQGQPKKGQTVIANVLDAVSAGGDLAQDLANQCNNKMVESVKKLDKKLDPYRAHYRHNPNGHMKRPEGVEWKDHFINKDKAKQAFLKAGGQVERKNQPFRSLG